MRPLADQTWPEIAATVRQGAILTIPVGSTEQHGPHLPLSTDADIAVALAVGLSRRRSGVLVAPLMPYGSSGEHAQFPGTLSIGQEAIELILVELGRSAAIHFEHVLFVSAHGGNGAAVTRAEQRLRAEGRSALAWMPRLPGDPHAGREETSLQLFLEPARVRPGAAAAGDRRSLEELMPLLVAGGVGSVSANGVLGDPAGASSAEGRLLFDRLLYQLDDAVGSWLSPVTCEPGSGGPAAQVERPWRKGA